MSFGRVSLPSSKVSLSLPMRSSFTFAVRVMPSDCSHELFDLLVGSFTYSRLVEASRVKAPLSFSLLTVPLLRHSRPISQQ